MLHAVVLMASATGLLGRGSGLGAVSMAFHRQWVAIVALVLFLALRGKRPGKAPWGSLKVAVSGLAIGLHWVGFFGAINVSNVSTGVVFLATTPTFTALLQPLLLKKRFQPLDLSLGLASVFGMVLVFGHAPDAAAAAPFGVLAAIMACLFGLLNAQNATRFRLTDLMIAQFTYGMGTVAVSSFFFEPLELPSGDDWWLVLVLGTVCTAWTISMAVHLLKVISPFNMAIAINLEPLYAMALALVIFGKTEVMAPGFYPGVGVLVLCTFLKPVVMPFLARRRR